MFSLSEKGKCVIMFAETQSIKTTQRFRNMFNKFTKQYNPSYGKRYHSPPILKFTEALTIKWKKNYRYKCWKCLPPT